MRIASSGPLRKGVTSDQPRRHLHRLAPAVLLALSIYAVVEARRLGVDGLEEPGPGMWPLVVATAVGLTATVLVLTESPEAYDAWTSRSGRVALALASLGIYIVLFQMIGFTLATAFVLMVWLKLLGQES